MIHTNPLSPHQIRELSRKHAVALAEVIDTMPCRYDLDYDDVVAITARILVDHAEILCDVVSTGTGLSGAQVQSTPWLNVIQLGCEIIEVTGEAWRSAWPNRFLQNIACEELLPFSRFVCGEAL